MSTLDYDAAIEVVDEWIRRLDRLAALNRTYSSGDARRIEMTEIDEWLTGRQPMLSRISAMFFGQAYGTALAKYYRSDSSWQGTREHALRLRARLEQREEYELLFEPRGPRLAAANLHPWVWDAAVGLWNGGHRKAAVTHAATTIEVQVQSKSGVELSGVKLVGEVFSLEPPKDGRLRLRLPDSGSEGSDRWKSAHLGAMELGKGCFQGIRNLVAHTAAELDEQMALEFLATLSVFARWVDSASVER